MSERLSAEERAKQFVSRLLSDVVPEGGYTAENWPTSGIDGEELVKRLSAVIQDAEKAATKAEREPITDKSICSRGHPKACLVAGPCSDPGDDYYYSESLDAPKCSACAQLEELLRKARERAIAWGRLDQHKEDCQDVDCKYTSIQGKIIKGCSKHLALQRQLAELEKARAIEGKG